MQAGKDLSDSLDNEQRKTLEEIEVFQPPREKDVGEEPLSDLRRMLARHS
jgi:hypothetical protein